ncbi:phosphoribosylamine--glycine ligase [Deltaproteobacteria bacterium TL4]
MKVLIVGSGGREHALAWKMRQSPQVSQVYVAPGNEGMKTHAETVALKSHEEIIKFVEEQQIQLTVVGQEVYLVNGLSDELEARGHHVFGPSAAAAQLEGSKSFSKDFMKRHNIPTAAYGVFTELLPALAYLKTQAAPYVIKANGLAAGKGVLICLSFEDAEQQARAILEKNAFGDAGRSIVIEAFMQGEEASCFVFTDGSAMVLCPFAQDHKRIGDLDSGLNTGGMGAYIPAPVVTEDVRQKVLEQIVTPTIVGMASEGTPYKGVLYIGLMIENGDPKVVEYNCRFGDPECQPLMMQLKSDLFPLAMATVKGTLASEKPEWHEGAVACVVLASEGYPGSYQKGEIISGFDAHQPAEKEQDYCVFHSGTRLDGSVYRTAGGRVLGVTARAPNLEKALRRSYEVISSIHWKGMNYRTDIGLKGLLHYRDQRPKNSVGILIGSQSDLEVARKATAVLEEFKVGYRLAISSAHRTPERTRQFLHDCENEGIEVFIAMAGMAAHLPGVIAAETTRPVIGVPIAATMQGIDALLAIAQMPPGIPVSTMATNGSVNAALSAIEILAIRYTDLRARLRLYRMEMKQQVINAHLSAGLEEL